MIVILSFINALRTKRERNNLIYSGKPDMKISMFLMVCKKIVLINRIYY